MEDFIWSAMMKRTFGVELLVMNLFRVGQLKGFLKTVLIDLLLCPENVHFPFAEEINMPSPDFSEEFLIRKLTSAGRP